MSFVRRGLDAKAVSRQKSGGEGAGLLRVREIGLLQDSDDLGLYLLFDPGKRPSVEAIHSFANAWGTVRVSHEPAASSLHIGNFTDGTALVQGTGAEIAPLARHWLELLRDGLTFDLSGLAPGAGFVAPVVQHRFDWSHEQDADHFQSLRLTIGPHLQGAERSVPVLRSMIALARDFCLYFEELVAVVWQPAASLIGRRFFESTAAAWLDGGPFPALGLTAFELAGDGTLRSCGLGHWIGQEIAIDSQIAQDRVAATRLGVRLVNHLVMLGGLDRAEHIIAPDGARLVMLPSADRKLIEVKRE